MERMQGEGDLDHLTDEDKVMIHDSWGKVYQHRDDAGVAILMSLFVNHPPSKQYFSQFKDIEDLKELEQNPQLKNHARRVMNAINTLVKNINNPEKVASVLSLLGKSHALRHKVEPKYFKILSEVILTVLGETFTEVMTTEVAEAWRKLLATICCSINVVYEEVGWSENSTS